MIYIMVVDDEPISADGVSGFLESAEETDWVIRTCYSPREALQSLNARVDVLIADVLMPDMNGVELAKRVVERWPMAKVIFLTASPGIERAQDAVRMPESVDYLLKDDDLQGLVDAIHKAVHIIGEEQAALSTRRELEQQVLEAVPILQTTWLTQLIRGSAPPPDSFQRQLERLQLPLCADSVLMLVAQFASASAEAEDFSYLSLDNLLQKYTGGMLNRFAISPGALRAVWLFQPRTMEQADSARFLFAALDIVQEAYVRAGGTVSFVLDDAFYPWQQVSQRYKKLNRRLMSDSPDALVRQDELRQDDDAWDSLSAQAMSAQLEAGRTDAVIENIRRLSAQPPQTLGERLDAYRVLLKVISGYIARRQLPEDLARALPQPCPPLAKDTWGTAMNGFVELVRRLTGDQGSNADLRMERFINRVKEIVKTELAGDLSLITVSDRVCMSPSYFSRQFKKGTGTGFAEYVMLKRIQAGEDMLRRTNLPLSAITSQIGYYSVSHFISSFSKQYHMTPNEYRKYLILSQQK